MKIVVLLKSQDKQLKVSLGCLPVYALDPRWTCLKLLQGINIRGTLFLNLFMM